MIPVLRESPNAEWDDERLIAHCLQGHAAAWNALIEKHKRLIYAIPFRYGAVAEDADDIFQNVCIELYGELPRLRHAHALRGWLATVTARQSLRWRQRRQRRNETEFDDSWELASASEAPPIEALERGQIVHEAIARIPDRCRRLLRMLFFEDPPRPYDEVARSLGLAKGSIGFIRGRCMDKLRKALQEAGF